jgi:hypothetical protein
MAWHARNQLLYQMKPSTKTIKNYNQKQQLHGYQKYYNIYDVLWFRGNFNRNLMIGYTERHIVIKSRTIYYIK